MNLNRRHFATTRTGTIQHVVAGVSEWYSGMTAVAECGARVRVHEHKPPAGFVTLPAGTCRRCAAALSCTVEVLP